MDAQRAFRYNERNKVIRIIPYNHIHYRVIEVGADNIPEAGQNIKAQLLPLVELGAENPGDALEAGGQVGRAAQEAGQQRPNLISQHLIGLACDLVAGGQARFGSIQALGRQRQEVVGEEGKLGPADPVPHDRQQPGRFELGVVALRT